MIVKGKSVIGLNIVTIDNGAVIETVSDLAYNPNTHLVEALIISNGGLFSSAKAISMQDVRNIGQDAVIVPNSSVVKSVKNHSESISAIASSNKYLVKTNVLTIDGKELGKVTDIYFDSETGKVATMEVSQGGIKTLTEGKKSIKPSDIVTIGADATIVSNYTEEKLEEQGEENGLKGALNDTRDKVAEITADTKDRLDYTTDSMKDRSNELKNAAEDKTAVAKKKINKLANDTKEQLEDVKDKNSNKVTTARTEGRKMVEQTKKKYEDGAKKVKVEKTKVTEK